MPVFAGPQPCLAIACRRAYRLLALRWRSALAATAELTGTAAARRRAARLSGCTSRAPTAQWALAGWPFPAAAGCRQRCTAPGLASGEDPFQRQVAGHRCKSFADSANVVRCLAATPGAVILYLLPRTPFRTTHRTCRHKRRQPPQGRVEQERQQQLCSIASEQTLCRPQKPQKRIHQAARRTTIPALRALDHAVPPAATGSAPP